MWVKGTLLQSLIHNSNCRVHTLSPKITTLPTPYITIERHSYTTHVYINSTIYLPMAGCE